MNKDMANYFDRLAPDWANDPSGYGTREKITSMMNLPPGGVIADIGCGKGVMFEHLLKTNPSKIFAVDVSSEMLRFAANLIHDDRIELINDDFLDIDLPRLDAAVFFNAYPHFMDKNALAEKLAETVKRNGKIIIAHNNGKLKINSRHMGQDTLKLSMPLENAEAEAAKFQRFFSLDGQIDKDDIYFIKMTRR